jgi:ABC-type Fe2+-enterobactin transport system substrate-binding protein
MINTSHNESLSHAALPFSGTRMVHGGILTRVGRTLTTDGSTWMFGGDTHTSAGGTQTVDDSTQMVDGSTLTVGGDTLTIDDPFVVSGYTLMNVAPGQSTVAP